MLNRDRTQGVALRLHRVALPWANLLLPLSGRKNEVHKLVYNNEGVAPGYDEKWPSAKTAFERGLKGRFLGSSRSSVRRREIIWFSDAEGWIF